VVLFLLYGFLIFISQCPNALLICSSSPTSSSSSISSHFSFFYFLPSACLSAISLSRYCVLFCSVQFVLCCCSHITLPFDLSKFAPSVVVCSASIPSLSILQNHASMQLSPLLPFYNFLVASIFIYTLSSITRHVSSCQCLYSSRVLFIGLLLGLSHHHLTPFIRNSAIFQDPQYLVISSPIFPLSFQSPFFSFSLILRHFSSCQFLYLFNSILSIGLLLGLSHHHLTPFIRNSAIFQDLHYLIILPHKFNLPFQSPFFSSLILRQLSSCQFPHVLNCILSIGLLLGLSHHHLTPFIRISAILQDLQHSIQVSHIRIRHNVINHSSFSTSTASKSLSNSSLLFFYLSSSLSHFYDSLSACGRGR